MNGLVVLWLFDAAWPLLCVVCCLLIECFSKSSLSFGSDCRVSDVRCQLGSREQPHLRRPSSTVLSSRLTVQRYNKYLNSPNDFEKIFMSYSCFMHSPSLTSFFSFFRILNLTKNLLCFAHFDRQSDAQRDYGSIEPTRREICFFNAEAQRRGYFSRRFWLYSEHILWL